MTRDVFSMIAPNSFTAACYDDNTIAQLEAALAGPADQADMEAWELTEEEWREEIELALDALREKEAEARNLLWFSVETPAVFREVRLPADADDMTDAEAEQMEALEALAEAHGTHVRSSTYRRG